jgi:hypothetical protein
LQAEPDDLRIFSPNEDDAMEPDLPLHTASR